MPTTRSLIYPVLVLAVALVACEKSRMSMLDQAEDEGIVWPSPPAAARVGYVMSFSNPEDLGIQKSFTELLGELITGSKIIRLVRPMAVVVTPDDTIFVADPGAEGVHRFDIKSDRYQLIQRQQRQFLPSPVALALGPAGEIYISDSQLDALFVIKPGAAEAVKVPLQAQLSQPTGVAIDPVSGRLYLVDTGNHKVKVFAPDGTFLTSFGQRGSGPGEFNYPTMIWRNLQGQYLVADTLNFRIQVFDTDGKFLYQFGEAGDGTGYHAQPKGIASDSDGHIYVVDSLFQNLQVFDPMGTYLLTVGQHGQGRGEFWLPTGVYISEQDAVYVADSFNQRVQVFRYLGEAP